MPPFGQARRADSSPRAEECQPPRLARCRSGGRGTVRCSSPARVVIQTAARLGITPAQVALQWLLRLASNVLLIPGTGSVAHLRENLAAEGVTLMTRRCANLDDGVGA